MAASQQDKANLAKKLVDAGADPDKAAQFAGAKAEATKAEATPAAKTPPEQVADAPEPKSRQLPKVTSGSSMSTTKSQRIIFGVVLFATGMTIIGDVLAGRTSVTDALPRRVAAGTIAGIMLMLLAIPMPKVAASLAGVIGVASLFVNPNGQKVLEAISKIGSNTNADTEQAQGGGTGGGARVK